MRRRSPKYWPKWYRILFGCCMAVMLLGEYWPGSADPGATRTSSASFWSASAS